MKKIKELISFCYGNDVVRYVFFGGCTTLVNLVCFYILWNLCHLNLNIANVISIIVAIIFAYIVNSKYVFQDKCETLRDHIRPFCKFISARLLTMVIEVGGVWLLCEKMGMNGMVGKFCTQFIVLALNYVFSKFFVFTTGKYKIQIRSGGIKMTLEETLAQIKPLDKNAMDVCRKTLGQYCETPAFSWKNGKTGDSDCGNHRQSGYENSKTCSGTNVCR